MTRIFLVFCLLLPWVALAQDELLRISITGATKQQERNIRAYLGELPTTPQLRASYIFNADNAAEKAMQAIGFYHSSIDLQLDQSKLPWHLTIEVSPGKPTLLRDVNVEILGTAAELPQFSRIAAENGLVTGNVLNHGDYTQIKTNLLSKGLLLGFFDGQLEQSRIEVDRDNHSAAIFLSYNSGPRYSYSQVQFTGNDLEPELLKSMVSFKENEPYDANKISQMHSELVNSGYFSGIKILPQLEQRADGQLPLITELTPAPSHKVNWGLGYATDTKIRTSITWRTPQVNRYGHSQETKLEYSTVNAYLRFRYHIPLSHPTRDQLIFGLGLESDEFADLESTQRSALIGRKTTADGWLRQYDLYLLEEQWNILSDANVGQFIMPRLTLSKTHRKGNPIDPSDGFRQMYQLAVGSNALGSESDIIRFTSNFRWLHSLTPSHKLVARAQLGVAHFQDKDLNDVPPSLRFYAGGDQSMRGFDYQSLGPVILYTDHLGHQKRLTVGGRYLAVGSLEYQYYLNSTWRLATFTDFGNAYDQIDETLQPEYSIGGGVHWMSPVGAVKVEVGYGLSAEEPSWPLHISMGAEL